jgi:aconitate hydratase
MQYLKDAGLMPYFEALGFHLAGFGCTTCIGNSGPLNPTIAECIAENDLNVAAVLSGNRNFEARIHQSIRSNFLASPMLVVAFALAGHIDIDMTYEPVGLDPNGRPVYLDDIWPSNEEIAAMVGKHVKREFFELEYGRIFDGDEFWRDLPDVKSVTYAWDEQSTYIKNPPYFEGFAIEPEPVGDIKAARALVVVGHSVTTDHISPAGAIPEAYPAGQYLVAQGVEPAGFNSYGSRRGNHEVMMRGTFGNIRLKNLLAEGKEGSFTVKFPEGDERFIYDAAMAYMKEKTPMVVLAGREYGTGSSRDWAAKGSNLLGVRAVIAESLERIHRSNLVGMGVLPLVFAAGENAAKLGLDGSEQFTIEGIEAIRPRQQLTVSAIKPDGSQISFKVTARLDTDIEVAYFKNGGILPYVLRKIIA